ncbi:MAG: SulP family inorganic anion transporter [Chloroherpetonaceae bacterium]|nr:SulP family inorganic anion transporter [Chthonomonadaceae bacterium]MDW8207314.1 SulP family inorganic anion transporter [Chloroherpetonaceae bacterium]
MSDARTAQRYSSIRHTFYRDFLASLVVFLVAIPLSIGIAYASGAPIISGLIAAAAGGIVVGLFGGAPLQVSGPAAGLTVLVFGLTQKYPWPVVCAVTVLAGLMQVGFGLLRIARVCLAISPAVVHGMLAGIGIIIALAQVHVMLGGAPNSSAWDNLRELPGQILGLHTHAAMLGLITLGILIGWQYAPKRLRVIPGPLVAVLIGTLVSTFLWTDVERVKLPENLFAHTWPQFTGVDPGGLIVSALTIAMIASVESLLCAVATDKLHTGPRANLDRELVGQGLGNTVSGMLGGMPITGVIVRTSANISSGAQTRLSTILHGVWVVLFTLFFSTQLQRIPLAVLASLLVFVGVRLVNVHHIRELSEHREAVVYFVTVFSVVFINLLAGVGIGIALAVILLLKRLSRVNILVEERAGKWHVRIDGTLSFFSVPQLTAQLERIPPGAMVDVDLMIDFMDHAAFDALHSWRVAYEKLGGHVDIDELHEAWYENAANGSPLAQKSDLLEPPRPESPATVEARS